MYYYKFIQKYSRDINKRLYESFNLLSFMDVNPIMLTDSYNLSHYFLKENVDKEISLIFNRNRPMILNGFSQVVYDLVNKPITLKMVVEAQDQALNMNMPFPAKMWLRVVNELDGCLPLKIEALPDGSWVPKNTPFAKIQNTIKDFGELVTWFEPLFMMASFDSGCATRAFEIRKYLESNKLPLNRVHSFGFRGHNSMENAIKAGKAWRLFLNGTDDFHTQLITDGKGQSIPATAHKTIQQFNDELKAYYYSIDQTKRYGYNIVVLVIDTYDPIRFIKYYSQKIAQYGKDKGVHIVFRPDSGHVKDQAFSLWCMMWSKDLLKYTSCIIGEGITFDKIKEYDKYFLEMGCNLNWFNYGMGSGLYNDINRDYLGFAMKTSFSNGENRMKFSADKFKESIPGNINVSMKESLTVSYDMSWSKYVTLYENSGISKVYTWAEIKQRAESCLTQELQEKITISKDVLKEQERLRKKYVTDITPSY